MPEHSKTRKLIKSRIKNTKRKIHQDIQHHHLLIRCEIATRPKKTDKKHIEKLIDDITTDIKMKKLGQLSFSVNSSDKSREGITALNVIETSHIAAHFWNNPNPHILHHPKSKALLQFDIYTCGRLTNRDIITALEHLALYKPTHVDITLLNRKYSLSINSHMTWNLSTEKTWKEWLEHQKLLS